MLVRSRQNLAHWRKGWGKITVAEAGKDRVKRAQTDKTREENGCHGCSFWLCNWNHHRNTKVKDNGIRNVAMVLSTNITCFKEFLFNREKLDWKIGFTACKQNLPEKCKKFPAEPHFLATAAKASRSECPWSCQWGQNDGSWSAS